MQDPKRIAPFLRPAAQQRKLRYRRVSPAFLKDLAVFKAEVERRNDSQTLNKQEIEHRWADLDRQLTRVDGKD